MKAVRQLGRTAVFAIGGSALLLLFVPARAACPVAGDETAIVAGVEPRLELRLADGRTLRLVGVDPATATPGDADLGEHARARLASALVGRSFALHLLGNKPDRWGRLPAFVFPGGGGPRAGGIATSVISAGLGRYLAEPAAHDCRDVLLDAEVAARADRLFLWRDPYYAVLATAARAEFDARSATLVVVEGRLTAIDAGPYRTKLLFAPPDFESRRPLAGVFTPRTAKLFEAQGLNVQSLVGRTVRMRGLLDLRFGPELEIEGPDAIEVLAPEPGATGRR